MTREDLFAHIMTGDYFKLVHVEALEEFGYVKPLPDITDRYIVVKEFPYEDITARIDDTVCIAPRDDKTGLPLWPEVLLIPLNMMEYIPDD